MSECRHQRSPVRNEDIVMLPNSEQVARQGVVHRLRSPWLQVSGADEQFLGREFDRSPRQVRSR